METQPIIAKIAINALIIEIMNHPLLTIKQVIEIGILLVLVESNGNVAQSRFAKIMEKTPKISS